VGLIALRFAEIWGDVRYSLRWLRRKPGFGAAAILTMAIGIGANTAVFSIIENVLFFSLPYPHSDRIVSGGTQHNLELKGSILVSDRYDDISMAHAAGCTGILVLSGYGRGEHEWNRHKWPRQPDAVVENLKEAVDLILPKRRRLAKAKR
jgi:hypothetical protein